MTRAVKALLCVAAAACAGPSVRAKRELSDLQASWDFDGAAERVLASRGDYGPSNAALFHLDAAQALADAGRREEADGHFAAAQDELERLWTISVSKRAGAALANENADDYRGEDFERSLSHVLRALNLAAQGRRESALVEAKRAEAFLDDAARASPGGRDDPFGRWLAARLYEDMGRLDDARISDAAAARAYEARSRETPPPPAAGEGDAEVVLVLLDGPAPRKVRRQGGGPVGLLLSTSYPAYDVAASSVAAVDVSAGGASARAEVAADLAAEAARVLEERLTRLKARSALRAAVKLTGSAVGIQAAESEFADVRGWATMPARIRAARLRVPSGRGSLRARLLDAGGGMLAERSADFSAPAGGRAWVVLRSAL